ncbi:MAG: GyrI-like domain-containing protein [Hyphomicrobium sp.]|jgi:AraC family transcriptional regulator|nr:GyrI-like domain-containing protein [Hyphomicrobium sp.]
MNSGLVYLRPTRLVYLRATGPYETSIPDAWSRLLAWHDKCGLGSPAGRGYGLARDNPERVGHDKCRYDACIEANPLIEERALRELGLITLPGGSYTRMRQATSYDSLRAIVSGLHAEFEAPRDLKLDERRPIVTIYLDDPRRTDDAKLRADVCVPVAAQRSSRDQEAA